MSLEILGLIALLALLIVIIVGFPIAFTLITLGVVFGYLGVGTKVFELMTFQFYGVMKDPLMAAVPLFIFMGLVLEKTGLMDRLFNSFQLLLSGVRGSLYIVVCVMSVLFAAATGIVAASVTLLAVMAGPSMKKGGYDVRLSAGIIASGGTLGILIPPSVMLIVMGPVMGVPVVDLYAAAIIPGLLLAGLFLTYVMGRCFFQPKLGPPLIRDKQVTFSYVLREFLVGVVPAIVLIFAALVSILAGVATPTEGAGLGAFGALLLTFLYREMTMKRLLEAIFQTLEISSMILFLVAGSTFFGAVISYLGTPIAVTEWLIQFNMPPIIMLAAIMLVIFLLAWPLEWVPIIIIIVPVFLPLIRQLGINLTWFSMLIAVVLQTAWLSPPVALAAYFLKGVIPDWDLKDIYIGMMQFMGLQLIGLFLVLLFPQIALWLPSVLLK